MAGFTVSIAGTERDLLDISMSLRSEALDTATVLIKDDVGDDLPDTGSEIVVTNPEGLDIIGGTIAERTTEIPQDFALAPTGTRRITLSVRSHMAIAFRRLVQYLADGEMTADTAIQLANFVNTHGAEGLSTSSVTAGGGVLVEGQTQFDLVYLYQALDFLADQTPGYTWGIDAGKNLFFRERTSSAAPFSITSSNAPISKIQVTDSLLRYRNAQYVFGSPTGIGAEHTETPENDATGGLTVVPTNYPIYSVTSLTDTDGTTALTVAREGEDTSADAWFTPGQKNIRLAAAAGAGGAWTVVYSATRRVIGYAERADAARLRLHEHALPAEYIRTDAQAMRVADGLLQRYDEVTKVTYQTFQHGLLPGQNQSIKLTEYGIATATNFLITSVSFNLLPTEDYSAATYRVEAVSGVPQGSDEAWLRSLTERDQNSSTGEGEKLDRIVPSNDNIGVGASAVIAEV